MSDMESQIRIERAIMTAFIDLLQNRDAMDKFYQSGKPELAFPAQIPLTNAYSTITAVYGFGKKRFKSLEYKALGKINTIHLTNDL